MQTNLQFRLNQPHVVAENFGDEIVAIHLERGNYYSIEKSGVAIWILATAGATLDEIITTITQTTADNLADGEVRTTVQHFLQDLQQADLVVPYTNGNRVPSPINAAVYPWDAKQQPFTLPILREYTDMQDLLLLDPIHDVDATGWPHVQRT